MPFSFDTKPNLNNRKFEQLSSECLNFSGTTSIFGSLCVIPTGIIDSFSGYKLSGYTFLDSSHICISSVFVGANSGANNRGYNEIAIGYNSLYNSCGNSNIAVGCNSLYSNTTGVGNIGIGVNTLLSSVSNSYNIAIGDNSLCTNNGGIYNIGLGYNTLKSNTIGCNNIGIGLEALKSNIGGKFNIGLGYKVLTNNTCGENNVGVGDSVLYCNISGNTNVGVGVNVLYNNKGGCSNTGIGNNVLYLNTFGQANTSIGYNSLSSNTIGCYNNAFGCGTLKSNINGCNNVAIGTRALFTNTCGNDNIGIGSNALSGNTLGLSNVGIGINSLQKNLTGCYNLGIGENTLCCNTTGCYNMAFGYNTLLNNNTGCNNVGIGYNILRTNSCGCNNLGLGYNVLYNNTTGCNNIALGFCSLCCNTTGINNIGIGYGSLRTNTDGSGNISIGCFNLYCNTSGSNNVSIGTCAGYAETGSNKFYVANNATCNLIYGEFDNNIITLPKLKLCETPTTGAGTDSLLVWNSTDKCVKKIANNTIIGGLVTGATSSTDNAIARFDGTTGKLIQNSGIVIDDSNYMGFGVAPTAQITQTSTSALESAPLGSELLTSSNWTTTDWTGDFINGFTHTTGNVIPLTNTLAAINATLYQIAFTVTNRTAGSFTITFGNETSGAYSSTNAWGVKTTGTGTLSITPTSDFNGTIVLSIKRITGTYAPTYQILDSTGISTLEIRSSLNSLNNTFIGKGAGSFNTTGSYNSAQGVNALRNNTTGSQNSAQGVYALYNNTTGSQNSAQGYAALYNNTTGSYNSAQGVYALYNNTTGSFNSAQGVYVLQNNTTGYNNSAQGYYALHSNTTGSNNSAQGVNALRNNTTGYNNSAQGVYVLQNNTTGYNNSAQGVYALYYNTTGSQNSAQGYGALYNNTTGSFNSAQGVNALYANTTGLNNSAQGYVALQSNTTGSYNSAQGVNAGRYLADGVTANQTSNNSVFLGANTKSKQAGQTNEIVIGNDAIGNGSNTATLGHTNVTDTYLRGNIHLETTPLSGNTSDGVLVWNSTDKYIKQVSSVACAINATTANNSTCLNGQLASYYAIASNTISTANNGLTKSGSNVRLGGALTGNTTITGAYKLSLCSGALMNTQCGYQISGDTILKLKEYCNIFIGLCSGLNDNTLITNSCNNIGIGKNVLNSTFIGTFNIGIGNNTLSNSSSSYNIAIGECVLYSNCGYGNTSVGYLSLYSNISGCENTAIGRHALNLNVNGSNNVAIGTYSGYYFCCTNLGSTCGSCNIYIGNCSKSLNNNSINQIVIGHNAVGNGNNTITLGNDSITTSIIKGNVILSTTPSTGSVGDSYLVWNSTDKCIKSVSCGSIISGATITANNGLTKSGTNVRLGGALTGNTGISGAYTMGFSNSILNLTGSTCVNISGPTRLLSTPSSGAVTDGILVWNSTDKTIKRVTSVNCAANANNSTCLNGQLASYYAVGAHVHGNITNTGCLGTVSGCVLVTSTGGCIIAASSVECATNATNAVNSTCLNGQLASYYAVASNTINTANNGLNKVGSNIRLGGALTGNTTITGVYTLSFCSGALLNTQCGYQISGNTVLITKNGNGIYLGIDSGTNSTSSSSNSIGIGWCSLKASIGGCSNIGIGYRAIASNCNGSHNIGIGHQTLASNISGYDNIAMGNDSLVMNINGCNNIGIGCDSLSHVIAGSNNIGIGVGSLQYTCNYNNIGIGVGSLYNDYTGFENIAVGFNALFSNVTGSTNVGIGTNALFNNRVNSNTGVGHEAQRFNCIGSFNTSIGFMSIYRNQTGCNNVGIGALTLFNNMVGSNNVSIGTCAGYNETGSNKFYLANNGSCNLIYGEFDNNIIILPKLKLCETPATGGASDCFLVWNSTDKCVKIVGNPNTGEANTASNLGTGYGIYSSKSGVDLRFKSLIAGSNVTMSCTANDITINANAGLITANNGLNVIGSNIRLGGALTGNTGISGAYTMGFNNTYLNLTGTSGVYISGPTKLLSTPATGTGTDGILVWNSTDKCVKQVSSVSCATNATNAVNSTCLNGQLASYYAIGTHAHGGITNAGCFGTVSGCVLVTGTGGCIIAASSVECATNATNAVNSTCLHGQLASYYAVASNVICSANNGLNKIGNNVRLGGALTGNTTIGGTYLLNINDNIINVNNPYYTHNRPLIYYNCFYNSYYIGSEGALGSNTVGLGYSVLNTSVDVGDGNTAIGGFILNKNMTGIQNVGVGTQIMGFGDALSYNIGIGDNVLPIADDSCYNIGIGIDVLHINKGHNNIAIGAQALSNLNNGDINDNIAIGVCSGIDSAGNNSVYIGQCAGFGNQDSNRLYIANNGACVLIYGEFDNNIVRLPYLKLCNAPSTGVDTDQLLTWNSTDCCVKSINNTFSSLWKSINANRASNTTFTVTGNQTPIFNRGVMVKWIESGVIKCAMVVSSSYSSVTTVTTVTIVGDTCNATAYDFRYTFMGIQKYEFKVAGTIGQTSTNVAQAYYVREEMRVIGGEISVGTLGTSNATTVNIINNTGTVTLISPSLTTSAYNSTPTAPASSGLTLALNDKITENITGVHTTPSVDLYVDLLVFPSRLLKLS